MYHVHIGTHHYIIIYFIILTFLVNFILSSHLHENNEITTSFYLLLQFHIYLSCMIIIIRVKFSTDGHYI